MYCRVAESAVETPETTVAHASEATTPSEEQYRDWMEGYWRSVREEHEEKLAQLQEPLEKCHENHEI